MAYLIGEKIGMTRLSQDGKFVPVTVVLFQDNFVSEVKTMGKDGYEAVQLATKAAKKSLSKAEAGHLKKNSLPPLKLLKEFRLDGSYEGQVGDKRDVSVFTDIEFVDVQARTKGCGFQGVIKRHNYSSHDASHGNSLSHRVPGSIGQCQDPGKVWKNKKLPGQYGHEIVTTQNLRVVKVDVEKNLVMIKGAIPGPNGSVVVVREAVKKQHKKGA
jgi:large subunit ribosomal protein L3